MAGEGALAVVEEGAKDEEVAAETEVATKIKVKATKTTQIKGINRIRAISNRIVAIGDVEEVAADESRAAGRNVEVATIKTTATIKAIAKETTTIRATEAATMEIVAVRTTTEADAVKNCSLKPLSSLRITFSH